MKKLRIDLIKITYDRPRIFWMAMSTRVEEQNQGREHCTRKYQGRRALLLEQLNKLLRWHGGRNFLNVSHLNRATLPGRQYLLDTLAKNTVPLRDAAAAPSEKKIELHGFLLQIGTVVFRERWHLRREADAIPANPPPQFTQ
jgi:hypothetical protein